MECPALNLYSVYYHCCCYAGRPLANSRYTYAAHLLCYCRENSQSCQFLVGLKQHEGLYHRARFELVYECQGVPLLH